MYKIIGADGKEYGPVSVDQLRELISQGRANLGTQVKIDNANAWQPLGSLQEFASAFTTPPPAAAQSHASITVRGKTSGMAIASLVLGVMGLFSCGVTALFGLVFGIVGFIAIKKSQGRLSGSGLAIAGIAVSAIFALMLPLFAALLLPALTKAKAKAQGILCMNNAKQITLGIILHADANTNACPSAENWCDAILSEVGTNRIFQCNAAKGSSTSHFAYNKKLDGFDIEKVKDPATTVMIFETEGGWNSSGGSELLLQKPRHASAVVIGFADGHVEMVGESRLAQLNWDP